MFMSYQTSQDQAVWM